MIMAIIWLILFLAATSVYSVQGLPVDPTPQTYPHVPETNGSLFEGWRESSLYAALPALVLVITAVGLLVGCTWCYRHKDCKPNEGADNQLFTASVTHLQDARRSQPPDSGFSEPVNNNVSEDNNNGPISLREMQNIANNNAAAYIVSENEERNRISRESVVEFEPLPAEIRVIDPLERCADWFAGEDFPRNQLQYLREIGRGWFGRVVEGEIEDGASNSTVAVKILNQNASLEDKARFLDEARLYRDMDHENVLGFVAKCLQEDPWILIFELCSMDLQQYLAVNRPKMAILNESGIPLQLMCDVTSALAHIHSRGYLYGNLRSGNVLIRGSDNPRAVLGQYVQNEPQHYYNASSDVWSLGFLIWEVCTWGAVPAADRLPPPPDLPCPYRDHLYQVMQLCWASNPEARPTAAQVHALINHLHFTHSHANDNASKDDGYASSDFEERWQRLKPNTIPKVDEHVAIIHAPSTSMASHFTGSDQDFDNAQTIQDSLSVEMDTAVSRSSSIMSDKDALSIQIKSESLTNLHGSLEDVRNIYLTHNETPALECHQGNISFEEVKEKEQDRSDSSMDPWLKDIITGSTEDVSYYKDVSDVIKNLDNILNSEKTSSSESSHQASPSRDNLSLECKKDYPMQTSMVKSPGINNFQNILGMGFDKSESSEPCDDDEGDRDTVGTLSHSFERHSDTTSQHTLENITPDTPIKDIDVANNIQTGAISDELSVINIKDLNHVHRDSELPNDSKIDNSNSDVPNLKELCVASMPSVSETMEQVILKQDCQTSYDNNIKNVSTDSTETKSIEDSKAFIINEIENQEKENVTVIASETFESEKNNVLNLNDIISPVVQDIASTKSEANNSLVSTNFNMDTENINNLRNTSTSDITSENENIKEGLVESSCISSKLVPSLQINQREDNIDTSIILPCEQHTEIYNSISEPVIHEFSSYMENLHTNQNLTEMNGKDEGTINNIIDSNLTSPISSCNHEVDMPQMNVKNIHGTNKTATCRNEVLSIELAEGPLIAASSERNDNLSQIRDDTLMFGNCDISINQSKDLSHKNHSSYPLNNFQDEIESVNLLCLTKSDILSAEKALNLEKSTESLPSIDIINSPSDRKLENTGVLESIANHLELNTEQPETVQTHTNIESDTDVLHVNNRIADKIHSLEKVSTPEQVQNRKDSIASLHTEEPNFEDARLSEQFNDTEYMDLTNDTNSKILKDNSIDNNYMYIIKSCLETSSSKTPYTLTTNESTAYLDLPSIINETHNFLHSEKCHSQYVEFKGNICTSTPKGSEPSAENTLESAEQEADVFCETKVPNYGPGVTLTKLETKYVPENLSPFDSPSKSHHTDTYDENSSVVLGSFENCTLELFKGIKSELADLPKEELLAFSSNFSEINLETPSPLRDGNFLNEVPDIVPDELHFDEIATISEAKPESQTANNTDETEEQSTTERRVSPLTPPNSPGNFLASTSQQMYLVDIDINPNPNNISAAYQDAIDLNQIELQITTKMAIAENENNMNIEYSGPLTEEGLTLDDTVMRDNDAIPEVYLAGNGGSLEDVRDNLAIDEERMKELRNELELKLPLAQVAGIEPAVPETEMTELPPPPELLVSYYTLSPIAEETGTQLCAYENDDPWNNSNQTESSASYPEPCNNSTDEVTDLPTGAQTAPQLSGSTYTVHSRDHNHTYTLHREPSSKEPTMSVDSLNARSPDKSKDVQSPIDDKTYTKNDDDEKDSNCERLSQVSPFLVSPTTDTSAPEMSDNVAGVSTVSKTTVPTDAKSSKPSETQCLSKATSIDSWCSNDTLYNVEENFDDLAMDPDIPLDFEAEPEKDKSESEDTLTHNDEEKGPSPCSTYIIHDSKSEVCETLSRDSITANYHTYTKEKTEAAGSTTPVIIDPSTKDLAYGTLMSGMPSHSNCTTELVSAFEDAWILPQPEQVRRSPIQDDTMYFTPPKDAEKRDISPNLSPQTPQLTTEPCVKKMDSVELSCLQDSPGEVNQSETCDAKQAHDEIHSLENNPDEVNQSETSDSKQAHNEMNSTTNYLFKDIAYSATSTPIVPIQNDENTAAIPLEIPQVEAQGSERLLNSFLNFQSFVESAEIRPQDLSSNTSEKCVSSEILLAGDSKTWSKDSNTHESDSNRQVSEISREVASIGEVLDSNREVSEINREVSTGSKDLSVPPYSDFEGSATTRPQDVHARKSSQSLENRESAEDFSNFESSVQNSRPQNLSSLIDASTLLIQNEKISSDLAMGAQTIQTNPDLNNTSQNCIVVEPESPVFASSNFTNLFGSRIDNSQPLNVFITDLDIEEETEQPHSIIITESPLIASTVSPNKTYDSHTRANCMDINYTYDSHTGYLPVKNIWQNDSTYSDQRVNGLMNEKCDVSDSECATETNLAYATPACISLERSPKVAQETSQEIESNTQIKESETKALISDKEALEASTSVNCNGGNQMYATVNFLNETFEELMESNVDDNDVGVTDLNKDDQTASSSEKSLEIVTDSESTRSPANTFDVLEGPTITIEQLYEDRLDANGVVQEEKQVTSLTEDFLQNEKKFCQLDSYFPLLSDIRFTGPATEIMTTSFTQDSPTDPTSPECEQDSKPDATAEILKEWDSDSDSHSTNSSSGEFIWKDGDGHETAVVPSTRFEHQRDSNSQPSHTGSGDVPSSAGSGDSASGSEGDEVEFVPSSWDCRAAPSKSSLRSLEQPPESKKRVVFKRQKYHCVYEYPREAADVDTDSPASYLPDFSTYSEWDPTSAEDAELGYGQLFGAPNPLDMFSLRAGIALGADYDEDFFISSSARPFESLGVMSSQFFPGAHLKPRDLEDFPPPPSPLTPLPATYVPTIPSIPATTPSLDFTTPDSGVEDITPGSITDDDFKAKKMPDSDSNQCWRLVDSASSSESVSPSSPGGESLGGLRHTRDKLKLDLPPSPHVPSPRHNRVFNFVLDKPKRRDEKPAEVTPPPLVMTDETPIITMALPVPKDCEDVMPEPTFSTFGKSSGTKPPPNNEPEKNIILTDEESIEAKEESSSKVEPVKGEGTVLDSGDEDSGIESSSKATLERNKTPNIS
ncbi:uncharacterized protein LOC123871810 isoform X2 [Maniola jurtina]|uniref:uncharacterized protein LOC123871810 isoform X2 n=1 Tax=Maniola jurtina TaxID=191418 RepID=UPI001E68DD5E|nr:uncharacterized protein LOC123871810 isoform X2 [Maniola jurtina]